MKIGKTEVLIFAIVVLSFVIGIYLYPQMPEKIASHWNARGEADGYMSKFWGLFLMPVVSIGLALLLVLLPKVDPLKANVRQFQKYYDRFIVLVMVFLLYIYLLTVYWNLGYRFNMIQLLAPAFAVLYYYLGVLVENARRNWFIGIRTPWTLGNDRVWEKTHRTGGRLFKLCGAIALPGAIFWQYAVIFILAPVILVALYTTVYSYFEYRKQVQLR